MMFLKFTFLLTLRTFLTTNASLVKQDVDPDLTDMKERLNKVEEQIADTLVEMADVKERLKHLGTLRTRTTTANIYNSVKVWLDGLQSFMLLLWNYGCNIYNNSANIHYSVGITDVETEGIWKLSKNNTEATYFDWSTAAEPKGKTIENCAMFASEHSTAGEIYVVQAMRGICVMGMKTKFARTFSEKRKINIVYLTILFIISPLLYGRLF